MATDACDLLVVGSGAGGLAAAVTAAHLGLKVIVVEKAPRFGGTTAWSGGWMWIPCNPLAREAGLHEAIDDPDGPLTYLRHELGAQFDADRVGAFLRHGPRMVDFLRRHTAVQFIDGHAIPDFHGRSPGARTGGRSVCAAPFDGRELGAEIARLREPLDLIAPWGMGIAAGADLRHFMNATRSLASFRHVARRVARHLRERLHHGRGLHLVAGNALVARLARSAFDLGVTIRTEAPVRRLRRGADGRIDGAVTVAPDGTETTITAARGVVLACGGFPHDVARRQALFAHAPTGREHWSAAPPENTGDGLRLGEAVGAAVACDLAHAGAWAPVSIVTRPDGSTGHFPHLIERGKPGLIAVRRDGQRFANEADAYHDVMKALFAATPPGEPPEAWLVCDHRFVRRHGLGHVRPAPLPLGASLRSGYLKRGADAAALARACGIDPQGLARTLADFNAHAREGRDPAFGRGDTPYNRLQGDAAHGGPNPCVAPIERAPFYAVRIVPGSLGTFAGLRGDAQARVLDGDGRPIPGLWAAGNDLSSVMGGHYPSGGITLGPAMTFGYLAAHDAAGRRPPDHDDV